jgi:hypothetical protein
MGYCLVPLRMCKQGHTLWDTPVKDTPVPTNVPWHDTILWTVYPKFSHSCRSPSEIDPQRHEVGMDPKWTNFLWDFKTFTDYRYCEWDTSKQTEVHVDASPVGLGAILSLPTPGKDDTQIIAYASTAELAKLIVRLRKREILIQINAVLPMNLISKLVTKFWFDKQKSLNNIQHLIHNHTRDKRHHDHCQPNWSYDNKELFKF